MRCQIHGGGTAILQALCAMKNGEFFERGLLHPFIDYEKTPAGLNELIDLMDDEGSCTSQNDQGPVGTSTRITSGGIGPIEVSDSPYFSTSACQTRFQTHRVLIRSFPHSVSIRVIRGCPLSETSVA